MLNACCAGLPVTVALIFPTTHTANATVSARLYPSEVACLQAIHAV